MDSSTHPEDERLRRFTLIVGLIFLIFICGGAHFKSNEVSLIWLGQLTIEKEWLIPLLLFLSAVYAASLFYYRKCYLGYSPRRIRRLFKECGMLISFEYESSGDFAKFKEQIDRRFADLGSNLEEEFGSCFKRLKNSAPSNILNEFFVNFGDRFKNDHSAALSILAKNHLEKFFPKISPQNLKADYFGKTSTLNVKISSLTLKTRLLCLLEDFIYILPLVPYVFGLICLFNTFF